MLYRWEPQYAERFDRCITVSEDDKKLLSTANPKLHVDVISNGVDTRLLNPLPPRNNQPTLLFIGTMNYKPCIDGMLFFYREVLPELKKKLPGIQLWIVGANPTPDVLALQGEGVFVTGRVKDIIPYYAKSSISIVPLRAGGGTRLKVLEAMALGRPVVSTTIGSEGIDADDGKHLLIADDPEQFAEQIYALMSDRDLYQRIATNARELVVSKYDWDVLTHKLEQIYAAPR
jgi:glycosyltransferase involved in cell wall biosynthesis